MKMNILATISILSLIALVGTAGAASAERNILPQYISSNITQDNGCPEGSDADFCFDENDDRNDNRDEGFADNSDNEDDKGVYACNVITDTDEFCKENLERNDKKRQDSNNKQSSGKATITIGYGDVGTYYGKGKVVIKNLDTGETLVNKKLNFAKQHRNQGPDCCVKVYTFDKDEVDRGDDISVKVTGGGGSWETSPYDYKKNLRISVTLDEIGEDVDGNIIYK